MAIKINSLQAENVKRIKAVLIEPAESGLTIIGGKNGQGKTSVLDTIAWVLGGDKFKPSEPRRDGSVIPPDINITLSNGLVVERKGKNSDLKVIDPSGNKGGQNLLNSFVEKLALDLPKFMQQSDKEKVQTLLQIIGVGDKLYELENEHQKIYDERRTIGQNADRKTKAAAEMESYPEAPDTLVSASELITQQQAILARNGENQLKRQNADRYNRELAEAQIAFDVAKERLKVAEKNATIARQSAESLHDESTAELEANISNIDEINRKVRINMNKEMIEEEAESLRREYKDLTAKLEQICKERLALFEGAQLPLEGLSVAISEDGKESNLAYKGYKWGNLSGADQLIVSVSIVRKLNPECGFVLIDKLEQMDLDTLNEFGTWLENEGLQAIATRVSTGDECQIIIEDGYVQPKEEKAGGVISWT
ncbi:MAG: AAA family ATPase [Clostridiales Family XIII bacterium]|jgi:predicted ATP-dependent endonuclease of OLD family|nr:AAA family ATPase [Clostridiales Family XIII bacterium]